MVTATEPKARIPVICAEPSTWVSSEIFDPNHWSTNSKALVQSCWTEYSVLNHCVEQLNTICGEAERTCKVQIATLQQQWAIAKFDLDKVVIFATQPDLHIRIEAFFSGVKSLLDLLVQLLPSEGIVSVAINGFHQSQDVYGGTVLNALRNNAPNSRKRLAAKVEALISEHKTSWIDRAICARNQLIHPEKGMHQLMFRLDFEESEGKLLCKKVSLPDIDSEPINQYAQMVIKQAQSFTSDFLVLLREAAVSANSMEPTC